MTVLKVRAGDGHAEVMFVESARIFRLLCHNPTYREALRELSAAAVSGCQVRVRFVEPNGDIIEEVTKGR